MLQSSAIPVPPGARKEIMKFAIVGAGGVGGYLGARLAQAGHDLAWLVRGRTLEALSERGLLLESPSGEVRLGRSARAAMRPRSPARSDLPTP